MDARGMIRGDVLMGTATMNHDEKFKERYFGNFRRSNHQRLLYLVPRRKILHHQPELLQPLLLSAQGVADVIPLVRRF